MIKELQGRIQDFRTGVRFWENMANAEREPRGLEALPPAESSDRACGQRSQGQSHTEAETLLAFERHLIRARFALFLLILGRPK